MVLSEAMLFRKVILRMTPENWIAYIAQLNFKDLWTTYRLHHEKWHKYQNVIGFAIVVSNLYD